MEALSRFLITPVVQLLTSNYSSTFHDSWIDRRNYFFPLVKWKQWFFFLCSKETICASFHVYNTSYFTTTEKNSSLHNQIQLYITEYKLIIVYGHLQCLSWLFSCHQLQSARQIVRKRNKVGKITRRPVAFCLRVLNNLIWLEF